MDLPGMLASAWANFGVTLSRSASWAGTGPAIEIATVSAVAARFIDRFMVHSPSEKHSKCPHHDPEKRTKNAKN
jgi:hypothetical protein